MRAALAALAVLLAVPATPALRADAPALPGWQAAAAGPASTCTPLIVGHWYISKRIVEGPGGPLDVTTFVAAGIFFRRGCHILSGRASLYLQFHYKVTEGKYEWRSIPRAADSGDLKGEPHTIFRLTIRPADQPDCTGTEGKYRLKVNFTPGEVELDGKRYHIQPSTEYFPPYDHAQKGVYLDCKNGAS